MSESYYRDEVLDELKSIYHQPFFNLIDQGRKTYLQHWHDNEIQLCKLLSIKTGGCSENCGYCAQSAHHHTDLQRQDLLGTETIVQHAQEAKNQGATRFCMGAAWKGIRENDPKFEQILETVRRVASLGLETCVTLGELSEGAARRLKEAGLCAYNHNLDTSPDYYTNIVSTHTYDDRLRTIAHVQRAGISVCCGGIIGMGESVEDRLKMLAVLRELTPPPESVPINNLMAMPGTPLEEQEPADIFELVKIIATARIAFPQAKVRLSAGRSLLSKEGQAMCFYAGANAIFMGDKLLTAANPDIDDDLRLLDELGLHGQPPRPHEHHDHHHHHESPVAASV